MLSRMSTAWALVLAAILIILVGAVDSLLGPIALGAFYLIPICLACWKAGRNMGIITAVVCTLVWLYVNGFVYKGPLIISWETATLLVFYLVVVFLLSAFQRAHHGLEEKVKELQAEIAERKRFQQAAIQAERLATVGTMAAQVAHEVRNPLGSISLNLELLHEELCKSDNTFATSDQKSAVFENIHAEIDRVTRVIEDYLRFARLPKLERHPVALNEFLDEKLAFIAGELESSKVSLHTSFDGAVGKVDADAEQLWQATLNLIRNSVDAMPSGGELTVGTSRDRAETRIRVADKGQGMNKDQLTHIFTPFFTTKPGGTGLGLALVQQIALEHGGHVECESHVGRGTTFTFFLPLTEKHRVAKEPLESMADGGECDV